MTTVSPKRIICEMETPKGRSSASGLPAAYDQSNGESTKQEASSPTSQMVTPPMENQVRWGNQSESSLQQQRRNGSLLSTSPLKASAKEEANEEVPNERQETNLTTAINAVMEKCSTPTNEDDDPDFIASSNAASSKEGLRHHETTPGKVTSSMTPPKAPVISSRNKADDPAMTTTSFDTSNVLAWLQSPTTMFSPGCFADDSMLNTPKTPLLPKHDAASSGTGGAPSRAILQTPTVSTSFFFSDVASLKSSHPSSEPRFVSTSNTANSTDTQPPQNHTAAASRNSIICISPLATTRKTSSSAVSTPMDLKEIFASPAERRKFHISSSARTQDLDAYNTDVLEDEDLSVLLQLAAKSNNSTPVVFRSPSLKRRSRAEGDDHALLQLPMIRSSGGDPHPRLTQKSTAENDFVPPQHPSLHSPTTTTTHVTSTAANGKKKEIYVSADKESGKKKLASSTYHHPLLYPSSMPPADHHSSHVPPSYYPPPGAGGSMSITVGKASSPPRHFPEYPPGAYPMYGPPYMGYPMYPTAPNASSAYPPLHMFPSGAAPPYKLQRKESKGGGKKNETAEKKRPAPEVASDLEIHASSAGGNNTSAKKNKKTAPPTGSSNKKKRSPSLPSVSSVDRQKAADMIQNLNAAAGGKNDKAAALAAAILRGVTMRPSGKWQAQLYFAGKSRYIGVFDTREKAALAYEIAREKLKSGQVSGPGGETSATENLVNLARKAAFDGVSETFLNGVTVSDAAHSPAAPVNS